MGPISDGARPLLTQRLSLPCGLLEHACSQYPVTPSWLLLSAWSLTISRYTDTSPVLCTVRNGTEPLALAPGHVVMDGETFAIDIHAETRVQDLLADPQGSLQVDRGGTRPHTALVVHPSPSGDGYRSEDTEYDLLLILDDGLRPQRLTIVYRTSPGRSGFTVRRLPSTLRQILEEFANHPTHAIRDLDLFSPEDQAQVALWNGSAPREAPQYASILQAIRKASLGSPNKPAVDAWDGVLTYEELEEASSRVASHLQQLGVCSNHRVPLMFEKSRWAIVAGLAILKAGAAFVPLDPAQPDARLQGILDQVTPSVAVASADQAARLASWVGTVVAVTAESVSAATTIPVLLPLPSPAANDLAYILFTSGSTGKPKGCMADHGALASLATLAAHFHIHTSSRVLQFASYSFVLAWFEVYCALATGATVCLPSEAERMNDLSGFINHKKVTWAILTPSTALSLDADQIIPSTLATLVVGGEMMPAQLRSVWAPRVQLLQAYGLTEACGPFCISPQMNAESDSRLIGHSPGFTQWLVDPDSHHRLAPIGAVAELMIEGRGLAQGYLHDPERTSQAFVLNPDWLAAFGRSDSRRLYKTGDLVQYAAEDGGLRYIGRKDVQVKVRGQRVELGEVEVHLRRTWPHHDRIDQIVVEGVRPADAPERSILAAFINGPQYLSSSDRGNGRDTGSYFARPGDTLFHAHVRATQTRLQELLPDYMLPSVYIPLRSVPMTITGKLDRRALREAAATLTRAALDAFTFSPDDVPVVAPRTAMEAKVQRLMARALEVEPGMLGIHQSFFRLGGDSLLAMRFVALAATENLRCEVADVFNHPRLGALAARIEERKPSPQDDQGESGSCHDPFCMIPAADVSSLLGAAVDQCKLREEEIEDVYPCTAMQEGLMSLTAQETGKYTCQMVYRLPDEVDLDKLQEAWQQAVDANPILRTRIISALPGTLHQVVAVRASIEWTRSDSLGQYKRDDQANQMGLGRPLVRFALIGPSPGGERHLVLTVHHALLDDWTVRSLLNQVHRAYQGEPLPVRPFAPFVRYTLAQNTASREFWASEFNDLEAPEFPQGAAHHHRIANPTGVVTSTIQTGVSKTPSEATFSNMIRLAWAVVLSHHTDSRDVVYGVTVFGRSAPLPGITEITGPTIATYPLRVQLDDTQTVQEALENVQAHVTRILPHEQIGVQNLRRINGDTAAACGFQTHLGIQMPDNNDNDTIEPRGMRLMYPVDVWDDYRAFASYAWVMVCELPSRGSDELRVTAHFDPDMIGETKAGRLLRHFGHVLKQIRALPDAVLGSLEGACPDDVEELMAWNRSVPQAQQTTLHEMALQHAQGTSLAISAWDQSLTFRELDALSAQLGRALIHCGLQPGDLVPLCFEKSVWPVVSMLAVLRAGGAVVNLDPGLPGDRIRGMLGDFHPRILLASEENTSKMREYAQPGVKVLTVPLSSPGDTDGHTHGDTATHYPLPQVHPSDAAVILFTSGSTGRPKGIIMEHVNLATCIHHHNTTLQVTAASRMLHFASYAFDTSIYEIFTTLAMGGCLCIPSESDRVSRLAGFIREHQVNVALLTPSALTALQPGDVPTLKTIELGGEAVTHENVRTWASRLNLLNGYGPAEVTICASGLLPPQGWETGVIGPMFGSCGWVTMPGDPSRLAPLGVIGELLIEGPIVTRGYLNQPDKTRAAFIDPPAWLQRLRPEGAGRLYRSGDLVQLTDDGWIRFIGRKDTQVKLRGQRVELGEVERHLRVEWEDAAEVIAEVVRPSPSSALLVAFIQERRDDPEPLGCQSPGDGVLGCSSPAFLHRAHMVREQLQRLLPSYMVPAAFVPLAQVPRTRSCKISRAALRDLLSQSQLSSFLVPSASGTTPADKQEPANATERLLLTLIAKALAISPDSVSMGDNLFGLGGDSITAMVLASAAQRDGLVLAVSDIMQHPGIADMARFMTERSCAGEDGTYRVPPGALVQLDNPQDYERTVRRLASQYGFSAADVTDILPLTHFQKEYLEVDLYTVFALDLPAAIDPDRIRAAVRAVVDKYDVLRMVFVPLQGELVQVMLERAPIELHSVTAPVAGDSLDDWVEHLVQDEMLAPVPHGMPWFQPTLVSSQEDDARHILLLPLAHAQYDGIAFPLLLADLSTAYEGSQLAPGPSFGAYLARRHTYNSTHGAWDFWREYLQGSTVTTFSLPAEHPNQHKPEYTVRRRTTLRIPVVPAGFTVATLLKATWVLLLARQTGSRDLVFGQLVNGRNLPFDGVDQVVGALLHIIPVRIRLQAHWTTRNLLQHVADQHAHTLPFEAVDLEDIVSRSTTWPADTRLATVLQHNNIPMNSTLPFAGVPCRITGYVSDMHDRDLHLISTPGDRQNELVVDFSAPSRMVDEDMAGRLLHQLSEVVLWLGGDMEQPVSQILSRPEKNEDFRVEGVQERGKGDLLSS